MRKPVMDLFRSVRFINYLPNLLALFEKHYKKVYETATLFSGFR